MEDNKSKKKPNLADKGSENHIDVSRHAKEQVLLILLGQRRQVDLAQRQIHVLLAADARRVLGAHGQKHAVRVLGQHLEREAAVGDKDVLPEAHRLAQLLVVAVERLGVAVVAARVVRGQREDRVLLVLDLGRCQRAGADLGALGVERDRHRAASRKR